MKILIQSLQTNFEMTQSHSEIDNKQSFCDAFKLFQCPKVHIVVPFVCKFSTLRLHYLREGVCEVQNYASLEKINQFNITTVRFIRTQLTIK